MTRQSVVVTGASAGVGRAVAQAYARRGARVGLIARGIAGLRAAERDCRELGAADARIAVCDVSDPDQLFRAADELALALGSPEVWVNNAMISVLAPVWEITPEEYRRVNDVNYLGTVHGTLAALRTMRERRRGTIVQVGSALAYQGIPLQAAYCASKHAIQGFVDSLRAELLHEYPGVKVTMVQLPAINTPQYSWLRSRMPRRPRPIAPVYQPEAAARAVLHAADHAPREHNLALKRVRLLNAIAPGLFERLLAGVAYGAQQTEEPVDPRRPDNIDMPLDADEDYGAHGAFDSEATYRP